jgi:hypothetical protein
LFKSADSAATDKVRPALVGGASNRTTVVTTAHVKRISLCRCCIEVNLPWMTEMLPDEERRVAQVDYSGPAAVPVREA